jgi:hypothetical protein
MSVETSHLERERLTQHLPTHTKFFCNLINFHWSTPKYLENSRVVASGDGGMATGLIGKYSISRALSLLEAPSTYLGPVVLDHCFSGGF